MAEMQITTPERLPDEQSTDQALRPARLAEFVGQPQVKSSLQIAIDAARGGGRRSTTRSSSGRRAWARRRSPC
jgi:Holliday junction resolvasome, helicase subunit